MYYIINDEIKPLTEQKQNKENIINIYRNGGQIISNEPFSLVLEDLSEDILYTFDEDNQEYIDIMLLGSFYFLINLWLHLDYYYLQLFLFFVQYI